MLGYTLSSVSVFFGFAIIFYLFAFYDNNFPFSSIFRLCVAADVTDNELILMETVHLFVELLDQNFSNVCELDIVFHFNTVYAMLDEFILAGEVQDTSKKNILERIKELEKLE